MRFSLIVATLNRTTELEKLFESLQNQSHRDFEVIVVDQNSDGRLLPILKAFDDRLQIRRLTSAPGLSRARNVGLRVATGDVVCFPDDDCEYAEDVLQEVNRRFAANPERHGIVGDSLDEKGKRTLPWPVRAGKMTFIKSWQRSISYAIFLRREVIQKVGQFDEALGVGSGTPWGAGEDNDFVLRALKEGFLIYYDPEVHVRHPRMFLTLDERGLAKRQSYARGDGKLRQKHGMPFWWDVLLFSIPLGRALLSALQFKFKASQAHWVTFRGRLEGWFSDRSICS